MPATRMADMHHSSKNETLFPVDVLDDSSNIHAYRVNVIAKLETRSNYPADTTSG